MSYDQGTIDKLAWQYGPYRAAKIVAGQDGRTTRDLGRWERLTLLAATPAAIARRERADRDEKIVRLYRSGVHPELIGDRMGLAEATVTAVLRPVFGSLGWGQSR